MVGCSFGVFLPKVLVWGELSPSDPGNKSHKACNALGLVLLEARRGKKPWKPVRDIYCSSTCPAVIRNTLPAGFHPALPSPVPDQPRACFVQPRQKPPRTGCTWRSCARFGTGRTRLRSTQENCQFFSRNCRFSPREQKHGAVRAAQLLWGAFLAGGWVKSSAGINVRGEVRGEGRGAGLRPGRGLMGAALGAVPGAGRGNTL